MRLFGYVLLFFGCGFIAHAAAESPPVTQKDFQQATQTLRQDITQVANSIGPQLQKQQDLMQQQILQIQKQLQNDINKLQQQVDKMQKSNVQQLEVLQQQINEIQKKIKK